MIFSLYYYDHNVKDRMSGWSHEKMGGGGKYAKVPIHTHTHIYTYIFTNRQYLYKGCEKGDLILYTTTYLKSFQNMASNEF